MACPFGFDQSSRPRSIASMRRSSSDKNTLAASLLEFGVGICKVRLATLLHRRQDIKSVINALIFTSRRKPPRVKLYCHITGASTSMPLSYGHRDVSYWLVLFVVSYDDRSRWRRCSLGYRADNASLFATQDWTRSLGSAR